MSTDEARHVTTEELVSSVVDEDALTPEARRHLEACPECGRMRERIAEDLRKLGWSARRFAPSLRGRSCCRRGRRRPSG